MKFGDDTELDALLNTMVEDICGKPLASGPMPDFVPPLITLRPGELPQALDLLGIALFDVSPALRIFQRAGEIVRVIRLPEPRKNSGLKRAAGSIVLDPLNAVGLVEVFERIAEFQKFRKRKADPDSGGEPVRVDCPMRIATAFLERRGAWRIAVLSGIITAPIMRSDGSIRMMPGYDSETNLFLASDEEWPAILQEPTREDAREALNVLLAPFEEFPFVGAGSSALAAAILTGLQRRLLPACPAFGFSAPAAGTGKSLTAESVATIVTGKPAPATAVSHEPEELRKAITAALREGHAIVNLDNVERPLSSPHLCAAITQNEYSDRLLGENKMLKLPTNVLWTITGNNLVLRGDLTRRALMCRIDSATERPEERSFRIADLPKHLTENRPQLVAAALTILRAFHVAGRPKMSVSVFGGFETWSREIREPLVWAGAADPCETRKEIRDEDEDRETAAALLKAMAKNFGDAPFTLKQVSESIEADLRDAVTGAATGKKGSVELRLLGWWCRRWRDRFVGRLRIRRAEGSVHSAALWEIEIEAKRGVS